MPLLERHTLIAGRSPAEVLDFCLDGANFPRIFPEPIRPAAGTSLDALRIEAGREFDFWHLMLGFVPAHWRVRIVEVVAGSHFVDEMVSGPMRAFRHEHIVIATPGGTRYTDRVTYRAVGGRLAERLFVDRYLARIFDARQRNMRQLLAP